MDNRNECVNIADLGDLREKRIAKGVSQMQAAVFCGVSVTAYQRWEHGVTKSLFRENYDKLVELLGD